MAKFICGLEGVRGRSLKVYDTKCIIDTKKTAGSFITGNFTDGEKTIFLCDVVGVQFKKSGGLIGYLQFETSSMQMNNSNSNMFSENTFTFEEGKNGVTNDLMQAIYNYVTDRIEEIKYNTTLIEETPNYNTIRYYKSASTANGGFAPMSQPTQAADTVPTPVTAPQPTGTEKQCTCGKVFVGKFCPACGKKAEEETEQFAETGFVATEQDPIEEETGLLVEDTEE